MMRKTIPTFLLAAAATLPLAGTAVAGSDARTDLVIADLGQPETNPWVINRHRFRALRRRGARRRVEGVRRPELRRAARRAGGIDHREPAARADLQPPDLSRGHPGSAAPRSQRNPGRGRRPARRVELRDGLRRKALHRPGHPEQHHLGRGDRPDHRRSRPQEGGDDLEPEGRHLGRGDLGTA